MKKALAIFVAYYRRLEGTVGKFFASIKGEHRTLNAERRTSNEESGGGAASAGAVEPVTQDDTRGSENRGEIKIVDKGQHPTTNIEHPTSNPDDAVPAAQSASMLPAAPAPGSAAVSAASLEPRRRDASAPRQPTARDESPAAPPSSAALAKDDPRFITRDELKRELASLHRLIESRK
jgi:hypothetical protein